MRSSGCRTRRRITSTDGGAGKLGRTYTSLRSAGLLNKVIPGCELSGPQTRAATLARR